MESPEGMLIALKAQVLEERRREIARAVTFHDIDPLRAAYHTGLADGKNNIASSIDAILTRASMMKGYKAHG